MAPGMLKLGEGSTKVCATLCNQILELLLIMSGPVHGKGPFANLQERFLFGSISHQLPRNARNASFTNAVLSTLQRPDLTMPRCATDQRGKIALKWQL